MNVRNLFIYFILGLNFIFQLLNRHFLHHFVPICSKKHFFYFVFTSNMKRVGYLNDYTGLPKKKLQRKQNRQWILSPFGNEYLFVFLLKNRAYFLYWSCGPKTWILIWFQVNSTRQFCSLIHRSTDNKMNLKGLRFLKVRNPELKLE